MAIIDTSPLRARRIFAQSNPPRFANVVVGGGITPIVELHHERPDGGGYPFGLRGDAIPLAARIVHVADAFDAITSARAYRPARAPAFAIDELQRGSGAEFDTASVDALCAALPSATSSEPQLQELLGREVLV